MVWDSVGVAEEECVVTVAGGRAGVARLLLCVQMSNSDTIDLKEREL